MLLEYRQKPKVTIWTFGIWPKLEWQSVRYVFYVLEGTIQKEVELK